MVKVFSPKVIARTRGKDADICVENELVWAFIGLQSSLWGPCLSEAEMRLMLDRLEVGAIWKEGNRVNGTSA